MIKPLLSLLLFCLALSASAQEKLKRADLTGSWHVAAISMKGGSIYYDFEKDSAFISEEVRKSWKTAEDSTMAQALTVGLMSAFKDAHLIFGADGTYEETSGKQSRKGNFEFDEASSTFTATYTTGKTNKAQVLRDKGMLRMEPQNGKADMQLYLRKD